MEDIDVIKQKVMLLIQERLKEITEKPYPYNHNEVKDLVDELTELYLESDRVSELSYELEQWENDYDDLKNEANDIVDKVDGFVNKMKVLLDSDDPDIKKLREEFNEFKELCKYVYF